MAFQIVQEPINTASKAPVITNWTPLIGYMLYYDASIAALFYYKIVVRVHAGESTGGTLLATLKQRRNGYSLDVASNYARAFFDLRDIINTQLVPTLYDQNDNTAPFKTIHNIGINIITEPFSASGDVSQGKVQIGAFTIYGFQNYSSSQSAAPSDVFTGALTNTHWYLQASLPLTSQRSGTAAYIQGTNFNVYSPADDNSLFLSDVASSSLAPYIVSTHSSGYINFVQEYDAHTVAFLNDNSKFDSDLHYIEIIYWDSSGSAVNSPEYIANISANGGLPPNNVGLADATRLLYFGCGPLNLELQNVESAARPSNNAGWAYYTIRGTSNNSGTINAKTKRYYFIKQDSSCKGYETVRLGWSNKVGGYDYYNFKMKSTMTIDIERDKYNKMLGVYNKSTWRYEDWDRGKSIRKVTAKRKQVINTDWITEADSDLIESCLLSNNVTTVRRIQNPNTSQIGQPVIVTDSSFIKKTVANDKMIQYTINIEYANPYNTNT